MKLTTACQRYTEIFYTEFHQKWQINMEITGKNSFMNACKMWQILHPFWKPTLTLKRFVKYFYIECN